MTPDQRRLDMTGTRMIVRDGTASLCADAWDGGAVLSVLTREEEVQLTLTPEAMRDFGAWLLANADAPAMVAAE
jgi:hypothetical protein